MECLFAGFDYALSNEDGAKKVLARDEESSFLTKHLKYMAEPESEGYKVGEPKNISFPARFGVQPANPRSVILKSVAFTVDNDFSLDIGDLKMSENLLEEAG